MLKSFRQQVVQRLWENYRATTPQMQRLETRLQEMGIKRLLLDHFAVIDLPGPYTGIPHLQNVFTSLGFSPRGKDYLADKQNDFLWMAEEDSDHAPAEHVLPQVVVADFRLEEMPPEIKSIIEKYAQQAKGISQQLLKTLIDRTISGETTARNQLSNLLASYFAGRDWPLPTVADFREVHAFNELLAWVLVFGRQPNHFTLSIHLLSQFADLSAFHEFVKNDLAFVLNQDGGVIKGGKHAGIAQGSTVGLPQMVRLADGDIQLPHRFIEFVWRYPQTNHKPVLWKDFFTGFIAQHADHVIESLGVRRHCLSELEG